MVVASVSGMNLSPSFFLVQVWRMAVLVFAVFRSSVFEVVVFCARFGCRDLGAPAVELEVEGRELGPQRLGVAELLVDAGEAHVGDPVGIAQSLEAELADS